MDVAEKKMKILFYHWPSEAVFLQYLFSGLSCLFVLQRKHAMSQHLSTLLQTTAAALEMLQKNKKEAAWVLFALIVGFNAGLGEPLPSFAAEKGWSTITDRGFVQIIDISFSNTLWREESWANSKDQAFSELDCIKYLSLGFSWIRSSETQLKILFKIWAVEILNMIPLWGIQYGCTLHKTEW